MRRRRISILSSSLSHNCLGRAHLLAKLLQEDFDVHVVGVDRRGIWEPLRGDQSVEYRAISPARVTRLWLGADRAIRRLIDGDLIYAVKPLHSSFGLGLRARRLTGRPLLLDVDDWEIGFLGATVWDELCSLPLDRLVSDQSPLSTRALDKVTHWADAITVSNRFLQVRYGGHWFPHARDERLFSEIPPGTRDDRCVLFVGTIREHKGIRDLLTAWHIVRAPDARLRIVGTPTESSAIAALRLSADERTIFEGPLPFDQLPRVIAAAHVVVIPQQACPASLGQLPAKLIDAMAASRAIVSTAVGDIPAWLESGAGVVVSPGDAPAMAAAIEALLADREGASAMGRRAYDRFLRFASFSTLRPRLVRLASDLMARRPIKPAEAAFAGEERQSA